eukprot:55951_1
MQLSFVLSLVVVCVVLPKSGMSALLDPCEPFFQEPDRDWSNGGLSFLPRKNLVDMLESVDADYSVTRRRGEETPPRFERILDTIAGPELQCSGDSCRMGCSDGYHIERRDARGTIEQPSEFQITCVFISGVSKYKWSYGNTPDPVKFPASKADLKKNPRLPRCVAHCSLVDLKRDLGDLNLGFANEQRGDIAARMSTDDDYYITVSDPTKYRFTHDQNVSLRAFCYRSSSDKPVWKFVLGDHLVQLSAFPPVVELTDQEKKEIQDALAKEYRLVEDDLAQQQEALDTKNRLVEQERLAKQRVELLSKQRQDALAKEYRLVEDDLAQQQEALSTKNRPVEEERLAKQRQHALAKKNRLAKDAQHDFFLYFFFAVIVALAIALLVITGYVIWV